MAVVKWRPGYDGGYPQQLEVWYRLASGNDYEWRKSSLLPASVTSYNIPDLQPQHSYYFSIRGINREGAGHFSDIVEAKGVPPVINRDPTKAGNRQDSLRRKFRLKCVIPTPFKWKSHCAVVTRWRLAIFLLAFQTSRPIKYQVTGSYLV